MSLKYEFLKWVMTLIHMKKLWEGKSTEELLERKRRTNKKRKIPTLHDKDFDIDDGCVDGFPVLKFIHKTRTKHAILYIIGSGMTSAPTTGAIKKGFRIAKETGADLYIPIHPLCTDYPITRAYRMIYETYRTMLQTYAAQYISVVGYSSGGNLALGLVPYINDQGASLSMPGYILSISPGNCVETDEEWQRMQELEKKDVLIPASYMKSAVEIMRHGAEDIPDYMLWLQKGDFSNCPKVTLIYGGDETLYACAPAIEATLTKYRAEYEVIVGAGMFHCYPVYPVVKEARDGWRRMIQLLIQHMGEEHAV